MELEGETARKPAPPIPVVLLTGFLGAGKTSLLAHLLTSPEVKTRNPAVLVNEFGTLGIDGALLPPGPYAKYEVNKGSIFCVCTRAELAAAFSEMAEHVRPGLVLVEATGIAEPRDLAAILAIPTLVERFTLAAQVCLVDPAVLPKVAHTLRSARAQVETAGLVLINKTDICDLKTIDQAERLIQRLHPGVPMLRCRYGKVDAERILGAISPQTQSHRNGKVRTDPPAEIFSVAFTEAGVVERRCFYQQIERWRESLLRAKGVVRFVDGPLFVEVSGGRVRSRPLRPGEAALAAPGASALALVFRGVAPGDALAALAACLEPGRV